MFNPNITTPPRSTSIPISVVPIKSIVPTPAQPNISTILPLKTLKFETEIPNLLPLDTKQKSFVDKNNKQQVFPVDQNLGNKE